MLWSTRHTRLNKFPIQSRIADGHSVIITLHYKSEMKSSKPFFRRVCLVVQFEIRVDRRQRLICKCLKSSDEDWPSANSENPKDDNNARKRGQFFGESVFVTEAWEIWSPVFAPVWRFLSMWKCPIKLLWWFAMPIQYNNKRRWQKYYALNIKSCGVDAALQQTYSIVSGFPTNTMLGGGDQNTRLGM